MTGSFLLLFVIFFPIFSAGMAFALGKKSEHLRDGFSIAAVFLTLISGIMLAMYYRDVELRLVDFGAIALHFRADGFRVLYACLTAFLWFVTTIFSPEYFSHSRNRNRYWFFNLLTFGAVMGVFFSADFRTVFLFFEIMSFSSYALVAHDENSKSIRAAETLLSVSVICGLVQLMGIWLLQVRMGTLEISRLYEMSLLMTDRSLLYLPGALLLIGFGAKAGMYPLHIWLPKAHPVAPAPASALLSGILTKTGVFGVVAITANIFIADQGWGVALLIPALITMMLGAVLGVFSNDLKRTLACSSVSQIGFILVGVAMLNLSGGSNVYAASGTLLHMVNHSLFKLVLFVAAGVVYINRHELALDKIQGFGRGKPVFFFAFLMAALGITGVPLWSGFVSKTLLKKSVSEAGYLFQGLPLETLFNFSYYAMVFTGGLTFAYMTKLFVALFVEKGTVAHGSSDAHGNVGAHDSHNEKRYLSIPAAIALAFSAALLPVLGSLTHSMDAIAGFGQSFFYVTPKEYPLAYLTWYNIRGALTSIVIGVVVYIVVVRLILMRRRSKIASFDLEDAVYRPVLSVLFKKPASVLQLEHLLYRPLLSFMILKPAYFLKTATSLPGIFLYKAFSVILKTTGEGSLSVSQAFKQWYRKILWKARTWWNSPARNGRFSWDMLFLSMGICVAVAYLFFRSFGGYQ